MGTRRSTRGNARGRAGFSLIELLILLAVVGLIAGVIALNGRTVLAGQQQKAALESVRQSIWNGATAAASRGKTIELYRTATALEVRDGKAVLQTFAMPASVTTNLPMGQVLLFTPPGQVDPTTLQALPSPLTLTVNGRTYTLQVSLIGEVKVTS